MLPTRKSPMLARIERLATDESILSTSIETGALVWLIILALMTLLFLP